VSMFRTIGITAFDLAWRNLCQKSLKPHFRDAFQELPCELMPRVLITEWVPDDSIIIRFMGTSRAEMWGEDLTGRNSLALMSPHVAAAVRSNLMTMVDHPCALLHLARYVTATGREMKMENLTAPLSNDPGKPLRWINYAEEISTHAYSDAPGGMHSVSERTWLNIGAGVPDAPPAGS